MQQVVAALHLEGADLHREQFHTAHHAAWHGISFMHHARVPHMLLRLDQQWWGSVLWWHGPQVVRRLPQHHTCSELLLMHVAGTCLLHACA
jgi:hypothetical protein